MCLFCGGACGGPGDMLMPLPAAGAVVAVSKVRGVRGACKKKSVGETEYKESKGESASDRKGTDL